MILTEAHFLDIKTKIKDEISLATKSIYIAVAWFTDIELFEALLAKANDGVMVNLALVRDEINFGGYGLKLNLLRDAGGEYYAIEGNLMHNKFCVIDSRTLITGSFNWTKKASQSNMENIIVTYDDYDLSHKYIDQFRIIIGGIESSKVSQDIGRVLKRLNIIKNLIALEEEEDLVLQAGRLKQDIEVEGVSTVIDYLQSKEYYNVVRLIDTINEKYNRVVLYEDPLIFALKLEIRDLEYRSVALDAEISEKENIINQYNHKSFEYLGELLRKILFLKKEYAFTDRMKNEYGEYEYQEAKQQYESYNKYRKTEYLEKYFELSVNEKAILKSLYREAAVLCHPDKFQGSKLERDAEEMFKTLNEAYKRQDLEAVREILANIKKGYFISSIDMVSDIEILQDKVRLLRLNLDKKIQVLDSLMMSEVYKTISSIDDLTVHFEKLKKELRNEYNFWRTKVSGNDVASGLEE